MQLKDAINNMFSFIWMQPIHVTLRQMRFVQVGLILSSQWLLWEIVDRLQLMDPVQAGMAYGAIAAALIAQIWSAVNSMSKPNQEDKA